MHTFDGKLIAYSKVYQKLVIFSMGKERFSVWMLIDPWECKEDAWYFSSIEAIKSAYPKDRIAVVQ